MPLRCLLYVVRIYEILLETEALYSSGLIEIVPPEFIVCYNGKEDYPEKSVLKLSEAFIDGSKQNLELTVRVININKGHSSGVFEKSENLRGYAELVNRIRVNQGNGMSLEVAINEAVIYCRNQKILYKFLNKHGGDVMSLLHSEFNMNDAKRIWREEGEKERAVKTAENLFKIGGLTIEQISQATDLSIKEVEKIKAKLST